MLNDGGYITSTDISSKQDAIGGSTSGTVITNTGTAGTVGSLAVDSTTGGTSSSGKLITSGAVNAGLATKQDALTDGTAGQVLESNGTSGVVWLSVTSDTYTNP